MESDIIKISHLNKSFGEVKAVNDLSFRVKKGELFAFLGVNGAGKSTTISIPVSYTHLSEKEINELLEKFKAGRTDAMLLNLDGRSYYLVYEKSDIQDWMFLGLVQADIVNDSMNSLQRSTILLVSAVVFCIATFFISLVIQKSRINLKKKDTEIMYRDELFQKLSMNVDAVFLMLDAKTYHADYVSPEVENLLGITVEQIRKDIRILGKLHMADQADQEKNYLEEIKVHEPVSYTHLDVYKRQAFIHRHIFRSYVL